MKAKSSIFYTITFIFLLAIISISLAFLWLIDFDKQNYARELNYKYSIVSRLNLYRLSGLIDNAEYKRQMKPFYMPRVKDEAQKDEIISNAVVIQEISADIGSSAILVYKKKHFLKIKHGDIVLLLQDKEYEPYRYLIFRVIWLIISAIIIISYIFVIKKIKPLRKLKRQIDKFANGNLKIKDVSTGDDEISQVAKAFYDSVMQINKLNESRQLFLRNIMHELKTPITKGRIATEMIEKGKNRDRLISVFEKLENLINEFAAVERATSGIKINNLITCPVDDIINEALDIAMMEKDCLEISNNDEIRVSVDFKLFSIAVKNMIDNGYKYSKDKKIKISINKENMSFITKGDKLERDLSFYLEPFSKGKNAVNSFGLGLYIVDSILKAHNLKLGYKYKDDKNIFYFVNFKNVVVE